MIGALGVGDLLHADPLVLGLALVEAFAYYFQAQVTNSVWLRVHPSAVLWVHSHSKQRYYCFVNPILDTKRHCLADETYVHGGAYLCRHCGLGKLGRHCGLGKEHPLNQRKRLPTNPLPFLFKCIAISISISTSVINHLYLFLCLHSITL